MKYSLPILLSLLLPACASMHSDDPSMLSFRVPGGSALALKKAIDIPAGKTHALIQSGQVITESNRNQYDLSCRLNFREFGPRTIEPEVLTIRRTEHREGWESRPNIYFYSSEIFLDSAKGTDIINMECGRWAVPPSFNFSFADMQQTLGDIVTFQFNFPASPQQK